MPAGGSLGSRSAIAMGRVASPSTLIADLLLHPVVHV
jgi:hypothetical protein